MSVKRPNLPGCVNYSAAVFYFLAAALIAIWTVAISAGINQREAVLREAGDEVDRMNQLLAEQTGSLIREVQSYLKLLDIWLSDNPAADPRTDRAFFHLVEHIRRNTRINIDIRFVSADDGLFYIPSADTVNPLSNVGDREYVQAQKNPSTRGFYIGSPVLSRVTKRWGIPVSYPLAGGNAGLSIIFSAIELPVLNELYETVRPKPDGAITLWRKDGVILNRVPFDPAVMGLSLKGIESFDRHIEGVQIDRSPIDNREKILSFRSLPGLPLEISVSVIKEDVLRPWRSRMSGWAAILSAVSALLVFLGLSLRKNLGLIVDSERTTKALNKELYAAKEMSQLFTEHSNDVFSVHTLPGLGCEYISPSIWRNRGWTPGEYLSLSPEEAFDPGVRFKIQAKLGEMANLLAAGDPAGHYGTIDVELPHRDGHFVSYELMVTILCDEEGKPDKMLALARDISERKANEEIIRHLAFYDGLTNLPNRRLLEERLLQQLVRAKRDGTLLALLFIDLDKFKPVNDTFGHTAGDWLLQQVANRMNGCLRASDTVARIGGDEFVVVLPEIASAESALQIGEKIRSAICVPFVWESSADIDISASIGIVLYPDHGDNMRDLLRLSDEAMFQAKNSGRNRVVLYSLGDRRKSAIYVPILPSRRF